MQRSNPAYRPPSDAAGYPPSGSRSLDNNSNPFLIAGEDDEEYDTPITDSRFRQAPMQSIDSGLPLTKAAAPPAGTGQSNMNNNQSNWTFDDDLPNTTFAGSDSFPGVAQPPRSKAPAPQKKKWKWPWAKEEKLTGERVIVLNGRASNAAQGFTSNYVSTSKYNLITFLPKFLAGMLISSHLLVLADVCTRAILKVCQHLLLVQCMHPANPRRVPNKSLHYYRTPGPRAPRFGF